VRLVVVVVGPGDPSGLVRDVLRSHGLAVTVVGPWGETWPAAPVVPDPDPPGPVVPNPHEVKAAMLERRRGAEA